MNRIVRAALPLLLVATLATACAARLGGPSPRNYTAAALQAGAAATAAETGQRLRAAGTDVALISADRDSAWFAGVAEAAGLELSGPGRIADRAFGFLSSLELLGDTTLSLEVTGGGSVHMHDALYRVDKERYLDLMLVRFDATDLRAAVRALLLYAATDVMPNAAVLLAIDAPTAALADSAAVLLRPYYPPTTECRNAPADLGQTGSIRLLYGPIARVTCRTARRLPDTQAGLITEVTVQR